MSGPSEVWIDERVAKTLPAAKDEELAERGVHQIQFLNVAKVRELVRQAAGPDEFIVQITDNGILYGLTNYGRLYAYGQPLGIQDRLDGVPEGHVGWHEVAGPELPT